MYTHVRVYLDLGLGDPPPGPCVRGSPHLDFGPDIWWQKCGTTWDRTPPPPLYTDGNTENITFSHSRGSERFTWFFIIWVREHKEECFGVSTICECKMFKWFLLQQVAFECAHVPTTPEWLHHSTSIHSMRTGFVGLHHLPKIKTNH